MAKSSKKSASNQSNSRSSNPIVKVEEKMDTTQTLLIKATPPVSLPAQDSNSSNTELSSLFECPVCFEFVLPPIFQCQNGHLICQACKPKLTHCPTCRVVINVNIRNLPMEKLAETVYFPCKFNSFGCKENFLYKDKPTHEEFCDHKPYYCPCPGSSCRWVGPLDNVMNHLTNQHKSITTLEGEDIVFLATDINLNGAVDWVMIQSCFNFHFLLVLEKQERHGTQQFIAGVQIIGTSKQAENFTYRLELSGHRRRLLWESSPRSILENNSNSPLQTVDCLVFDNTLAQRFAENGNLGINVTISQTLHRLDRH